MTANNKNLKPDKGRVAEKLLASFLSNKVFAHYVYLNPFKALSTEDANISLPEMKSDDKT